MAALEPLSGRAELGADTPSPVGTVQGQLGGTWLAEGQGQVPAETRILSCNTWRTSDQRKTQKLDSIKLTTFL